MNQTLLAIIIAFNLVSLVIFGLDKLQAIRGGGRIPESRLLQLAFLLPFGAMLAMLLFRHKTRKPKFMLVPLFTLIQLVLIFLYL